MILTPEVEEALRNAVKLMETQDPYLVTKFVYCLGHANATSEMAAMELAQLAMQRAALAS